MTNASAKAVTSVLANINKQNTNIKKKSLYYFQKKYKKRCPETESNRRHEDFQSSALPTELSGHIVISNNSRNYTVKLIYCQEFFNNFLIKPLLFVSISMYNVIY